MAKLRELRYREVVKRLRRFGFRFYRHGRGSHELWVRDVDGLIVPVPCHKGKPIRKGTLCEPSSGKSASVLTNLWN
ncbi:MAG: type II toxin-antitoxin system HicA family toxin [Chloroflexi bacterium]|nr:MAG: type II toxin-antitoxin system HicA family toxin [Chloroflexota bacterium]